MLTAENIVSAQPDISRATVSFGRIKNYQSDFGSDKEYAFYPEIALGGKLADSFLEWEIFGSYWTDGISEVFSVMDAATYSYSSAVFGARSNVMIFDLLKNFPLPVYGTAGISFHKIYEKYIGGSDLTGRHRADNSINQFTYDFGLGFDFELSRDLRLRIDAIIFTPFKPNTNLQNGGTCGVVKLNLDYCF